MKAAIPSHLTCSTCKNPLEIGFVVATGGPTKMGFAKEKKIAYPLGQGMDQFEGGVLSLNHIPAVRCKTCKQVIINYE